MIAELNGLLSSIRTLTDIVKANKSLRNFNELETALFEVNTKLSATMAVALETQEQQAALTNRIRDLEKENMELKDWNHERERYALHEIMTGRFVYRLQPSMENGEPAHDLCANCFTQGKKAILQVVQTPGFAKTAVCSLCKTEIGLETYQISMADLVRV